VAKRFFITIILFLCSYLPASADPISLTIGTSTVLIPMWVAATAAVIAVAGIATGITGSVLQANQQKAMMQYQEEVNQRNAAASRQAAQAKIEQQRRANKFLQGTQLAKLGGMGVTADGSSLLLLGQTAGQERYDELVTQYQGETQAIQFEQQAALNNYQSQVTDMNLGLNVTSQVIDGAGTALSMGSLLTGSAKPTTITGQGNLTGLA
jgi:hypothetical protein